MTSETGVPFLLRPLDLPVDDSRHPFETRVRKELMELLVHGSSSVKKSPAT